MSDEIKTDAEKAKSTLEAAISRAKAIEANTGSYVKTHLAVIGAAAGLIIGFILGRIV